MTMYVKFCQNNPNWNCICALQCKNKHKAEALQGTYYVGRLVKPVLDPDPAENRLSSFRPSSPLDALSDINLS